MLGKVPWIFRAEHEERFSVRVVARGSFWRVLHTYIIIKDGPDVYTIKKFGDISTSSCFFILTSVPFWTEGVLTEGNGATKRLLYPWMLKLLKLSPLNEERAPLVIFFFLTVLFLCLPDSRAAEDLGGAALGVLRDRGPWGP